MRWLTYFILGYVAIALQMGLAPFLAYHGAAPNLVLLAVVFIAVHAPRDAALLGCFGLGVMQDLVTQQPPGVFALSYGLVALLVVSVQQSVSRDHPLTHFSLTLAGGIIAMSILLLHAWVRPPSPRVQDLKRILPAIRLSPTIELTKVIYTALLAPLVLGALKRTGGLFSFQRERRRVRSW